MVNISTKVFHYLSTRGDIVHDVLVMDIGMTEVEHLTLSQVEEKPYVTSELEQPDSVCREKLSCRVKTVTRAVTMGRGTGAMPPLS